MNKVPPDATNTKPWLSWNRIMSILEGKVIWQNGCVGLLATKKFNRPDLVPIAITSCVAEMQLDALSTRQVRPSQVFEISNCDNAGSRFDIKRHNKEMASKRLEQYKAQHAMVAPFDCSVVNTELSQIASRDTWTSTILSLCRDTMRRCRSRRNTICRHRFGTRDKHNSKCLTLASQSWNIKTRPDDTAKI